MAESPEPELSDSDREQLARSEFALVVATFYPDLAERLANGAVEAFSEAGVSPASVHSHEVPGAFELPLAAKYVAETGRFAGVACLGVVIRGETSLTTTSAPRRPEASKRSSSPPASPAPSA